MTADEFKALLIASKPGDTIALTGDSPGLFRPKGALLEGRTLDARKMGSFGTLYPSGPVRGLTIRGGKWASVAIYGAEELDVRDAVFQGPEQPDGYGLVVNGGRKVAVLNCTFDGYKTGLVLSSVNGFSVRSCGFARMRSDGVQIGSSRYGHVLDCRFHGTRITGPEHPDFIQLMSEPSTPPTSDILIRGNKGIGPSQGICGFSHVREGVPDGGFDRIVIEENDLCCGAPQAICLMDARESRVLNNRVETYPGSKYRASINLSKSPGIVRSGNTVTAWGRSPAVAD